jgi:hypothetical protein
VIHTRRRVRLGRPRDRDTRRIDVDSGHLDRRIQLGRISRDQPVPRADAEHAALQSSQFVRQRLQRQHQEARSQECA